MFLVQVRIDGEGWQPFSVDHCKLRCILDRISWMCDGDLRYMNDMRVKRLLPGEVYEAEQAVIDKWGPD